jgi:hypothetical protein
MQMAGVMTGILEIGLHRLTDEDLISETPTGVLTKT